MEVPPFPKDEQSWSGMSRLDDGPAPDLLKESQQSVTHPSYPAAGSTGTPRLWEMCSLEGKYSLGHWDALLYFGVPWLPLPQSTPCHLPGIYLKRMASSFEGPLNKRLAINPVAT